MSRKNGRKKNPPRKHERKIMTASVVPTLEQQERRALDAFRRFYCSKDAPPVRESQAQVVVHLTKLLQALYATHNDELTATFGSTWKDYAFLWGPIREMLALAIHTYHVALGLLVSGNPREAKSLARSTLETSIDIQYIAQDPKSHFLAYIFATLEQDEKKLQHWGTALQSQPQTLYAKSRGVHALMLDSARKFKAQWLTTMTAWGAMTVPVWQSNVFERFRATGNELLYRSTYALLCSETHMDANEIMAIMRLVDYPDDASRRNFREAQSEDTYGNLIVVLGVLLESAKQYASVFKLPEIARAVDADGTFLVEQV